MSFKDLLIILEKLTYFDSRNIGEYIIIIIVISFIFSLYNFLFNFDFVLFIHSFLWTCAIIYFVFSFIVYLIYRIRGCDKWDDFFYKMCIIDSIFICMVILLKKYGL